MFLLLFGNRIQYFADVRATSKRPPVIYSRVKDNIVVKPQADILYTRGFLKPPGVDTDIEDKEYEELNDTDMEAANETPQNPNTTLEENNISAASEKSKTPTETPKPLTEKAKTPA